MWKGCFLAMARSLFFAYTKLICSQSLDFVHLGLMYLTLATFASIWTTKYHMSIGIGGLNYLALGIGFTIGSQVSV